jgi:hypothetical protein
MIANDIHPAGGAAKSEYLPRCNQYVKDIVADLPTGSIRVDYVNQLSFHYPLLLKVHQKIPDEHHADKIHPNSLLQQKKSISVPQG